MRRLSVYVETSVWNMAFADDSPVLSKASVDFFDRTSAFDYYISAIVTAEIALCYDPKKNLILDLIGKIRPKMLDLSPEIETLAQRYLSEEIIPAKYANDALHIAVASFYSIDFIVSFNFDHIVKEKTRNAVIGINALMMYKAPRIITPGEII